MKQKKLLIFMPSIEGGGVEKNLFIISKFLAHNINKVLLILPLIFTYLIGPIGLFLYWLIRIFYAKSINLYD